MGLNFNLATVASPPRSMIAPLSNSTVQIKLNPIDPITRLGIRLHYLKEFMEKAGGRSKFIGLTVRDVCERYIKPMTLYHKASFVDFMRLNRDPNIGNATVYVSHTWEDAFLEVLEALDHHFAVNNQHEIILWMDLFCINQHTIDTISRPTEWWTQSIQPIITHINRTVLILLPSEIPRCFSRTWCLFELYSNLRGKDFNNHLQQSQAKNAIGTAAGRPGKVELAMSPLGKQTFLQRLIEQRDSFLAQWLSAVQFETSLTSINDDRIKMLQVIHQQKMTLSAVNALIVQDLRQSIVFLIDQQILTVTTLGKADAQDPGLLHLYYLSGLLHEQLEQWESAEKSLQASIQQCKILTKEDSPNTPIYLSLLTHLATVLRQIQRFEQAQTYYEISLQKHRQVYGRDHRETLAVQSSYALLYEHQEQYDAALQLLKECYDRQVSVIGEFAAETLISLNQLGFLYQKVGNFDRAVHCHEIFYQQILRQQQKKLSHPNAITITAMANLAKSYHLAGKKSLAEDSYRQVSQWTEEVFGEKHPETLLAMHQFGLFYYEVGNYLEANRCYQQIYSDFLIVFGEQHPKMIVFYSDLANLYTACGEYPEAERLFFLAYQKNVQIYGDSHRNSLLCLKSLASVSEHLQKYLQAEKYYLQIYEKMKQIYGEIHKETLLAKETLELFRERQRNGNSSNGGNSDQKEQSITRNDSPLPFHRLSGGNDPKVEAGIVEEKDGDV